jgi:Repeating coiled region of VPS13
LGWINLDQEGSSTGGSQTVPPATPHATPHEGATESITGSQVSLRSFVTGDQPSSDASSRSSGEASIEAQRQKQELPKAPQSYESFASKSLSFGIKHIPSFPSSADVFLLVDLRLAKGSLTLRRRHNQTDSNHPLAAIKFTGFRPIFRTFTMPNEPNALPTWEFTSKLSKLIVIDESHPMSKFKKIVQAPRPAADGSAPLVVDSDDSSPVDFDDPALWRNPLFSLNAAQLSPKTGFNLRVDMRLEESLIFYHRRFVEEIVRFFKPPDKHETLNALFDAMMEATKEYASEKIENLRTADAPTTRSALEFAVTETLPNIIQLDLKAPLVIFPEEYLPS